MSVELQQSNLCQQQLLHHFMGTHAQQCCSTHAKARQESKKWGLLGIESSWHILSTQKTRRMHGVHQHPPAAYQLRI